MGSLQSVMKRKNEKISLPSNSPKAIQNRAGGVAFEIEDAATKLITMTGGAFFAEPRYYSTIDKAETSQRIRIANNAVEDYNHTELDSVAMDIIATAVDIIKSENPKDILSIANWLRNECNIRLTPQVLYVIASRFDETKPYIREYASKIIKRPDEIKTCLMLHRYLFGKKCLSKPFDHGLGDVLFKVGEASLLKYDGNTFPRWKDIMNWLSRRKNRPFREEIADYFMDGKTTSKIPIMRDRQLLNKKSIFDKEARKLAMSSHANWEVLISQFGNKSEIWEFLVENNLIGYMAMLRNIRNIVQSGVSDEILSCIYNKISSKDEVIESKQFPFRFLAAHRELEVIGNDRRINKILEAIEEATEVAVDNCPMLPGTSLVAIDTSGSMSSPLSKNSSINVIDAACMLGGIIAKRCSDAYVWQFDTRVAEVRFTKRTTIMGLMKNINNSGGSTNTHLVIEKMRKDGIFPDRLIILSDMQAWDSSGGWGSSGNCADEWDIYCKIKNGKNTWLHSINLNGYGDTPFLDPNDHLHLTSGFNESVLNSIVRAEGIVGSSSIRTVEYVRNNF